MPADMTLEERINMMSVSLWASLRNHDTQHPDIAVNVDEKMTQYFAEFGYQNARYTLDHLNALAMDAHVAKQVKQGNPPQFVIDAMNKGQSK